LSSDLSDARELVVAGIFLFPGGEMKRLSRDSWAVVVALGMAVLVKVGVLGKVPW
jgi:hypothetical protein